MWQFAVALAIVVALVYWVKRTPRGKAIVLKAETGTYDAMQEAIKVLHPVQPFKAAARIADNVLDTAIPIADAASVVVPGLVVPVKIAEAVDQKLDATIAKFT